MKGIILSVTAVVGAILVIAGAVVLFAVLPKAIQSKVADEMYIRNGTGEAFERFENLSVPLKWKLHFYNVENPQDFNGSLTSLNFTLRGPYIYDERRFKEDIVFDNTTNKVTYLERKEYVFNAKESEKESGHKLNDEDQITVIHLGLALQPNFLKEAPTFVPGLTLTDSVKNIAFDGIRTLLGTSLFKKDDKPKRTVGTGKDKIDDILQVYDYEGQEGKTKYWNYNETTPSMRHNPTGVCANLRGTDGTQFQPNVDSGSVLYVYENMVCRVFKFVKGLTDHEHEGISTLRFYTDPSNFAKSEDNSCFCYEEDTNDCPAALLNLRHCPPANTFDIDMISSQPFFLSNQDLLPESGIEHLVKKSDLTWEKYGTLVDVEPYTGLVLSARKRVQVNALLKKGSHASLMNLSKNKVVAPIVWIEEAGDVDQANAQKLKDKVFGPKRTFTGLLIGAMAAGVLILIITGAFAYFKR